MFGIFGGSTAKKKPLRYKVTVKGVTISRHSTLKNATKKAQSIRGAKISKLGSTRRKRY